SNALFIAEAVLHVPKDFPLYRQLITILIFTLSGVGHALGLWTIGPMCDVASALRWNILMGFALIFEDLVRWAFSGMVAGRRWRLFGYIWVWIYLAWSLPKMVFPNAACS